MLPKIEGAIVCRMLRTEGSIPIIMLTARSTEEEKLLGLDLGVDDYVTKPFSPRELVARVRVVLRRMDQLTQEKQVSVFCIDDLFVDFQAHEVKLKDKLVRLTPKEFQLLEVLAREAGKAFSRSELVNRVFGLGYEGLERTIDVHLMNLRKKIEPCPEQPTYLQTVYGIGYKLRK
jgi:DNA-binding response OmpR family regulator